MSLNSITVELKLTHPITVLLPTYTPSDSYRLLENGDYYLLENGDYKILG